jgi:hypothetical protein
MSTAQTPIIIANRPMLLRMAQLSSKYEAVSMYCCGGIWESMAAV